VEGGKCAFRIRRRLVLRLDIGKNNLTKKFQIPRALLTHPFPKYKRGKIDFFAREKSGPKRIQQIQMVRLKRKKMSPNINHGATIGLPAAKADERGDKESASLSSL
jgi:hypothetical protein